MKAYTYPPKGGERAFAQSPDNYPTFDLTFETNSGRHEGYANLFNFVVRRALDQGTVTREKLDDCTLLKGNFQAHELRSTPFELLLDLSVADLRVGDLNVKFGRSSRGGYPDNIFYKGKRLEVGDAKLGALALRLNRYEGHRDSLPGDILRQPGVLASVLYGDYEELLRQGAGNASLTFSARLVH